MTLMANLNSAIAAEPGKKILSQTFSSSQKFSAVLHRRIETLNNAPRQSIVARLGQAWHLPSDVLDQLNSDRGQERASRTLNIPSSG